MGTFLFAYIFSHYLERKQLESLEVVADIVSQEFNDKLEKLQTSVQLLSEQDSLRAALVSADAQSWPREISPLKPVLDADIIQVFNADGSTLLSVRQPVLQDISLNLDAQKRQSSSGNSTTGLVDTGDALFSTLVSTAPISDASEQLGYVLIGQAITSQLLQTIAERAGSKLVVFDGERQIASTFTERGEKFSQVQFSRERSQLTVTNGEHVIL